MAKKTLQRISVNEQLLNKYTRHSVFLQQLEKGEALRIGRFMKQNVFPSIFQKLMAELNKVKDIKTIGSARRIKRLNQMLATVRQTAIAGFVRAEKQAISRLVDISRFEAQWNINTIERTVPLDISMVMPSNAVLRTLVTTKAFGGPDNQHKLDTWFKSLSTAVRNNVNKQLRVGIASGESVPALGKRVQKAFNTGTKQAQAIARTATSAVVHNAREEVFKANKDIVPKVQWTATLDDRTTVVCINLDGKIFETGTGPRPPIHFQCRSTVVPVTPSWQEFGVSDPPPATRASMNGAVPAKLTYKKWLAQQSKATQVKVLGKKKAELYRSGRVKIEKFSSKDLKPLTLKQIAAREKVSIAPAPPTTGVAPTPTVAPSIKPSDKIITAKEFNVAKDRGDTVWYRGIKGRNASKFADDLRAGKQYMPKNDIFGQGTFIAVGKDADKMARFFAGKDGVVVRGVLNKNSKIIQKATAERRISIARNAADVSHESKMSAIIKRASAGDKSAFKDMEDLFAKKNASDKQFSIWSADPSKWAKAKGFDGMRQFNGNSFSEEIVLLNLKKTTIVDKDLLFGSSRPVVSVSSASRLSATPTTAPKTTTTVGTSFTNTVSKEFKESVEKQIASYPEKVKVALNEGSVTYKFGSRMTEIHPELKGLHPRGWARGTTWDSVSGMMHTNTNSISIAETYRPIRKKTFIKSLRTTGMLNHEVGHGFDVSINKSIAERYSSTLQFKTAYKKDVKKITPIINAQNNLDYFLQKKGAAGRDETFAEIFGDLMGQGSKASFTSEGIKFTDIREFFPESTKYVEGLLK